MLEKLRLRLRRLFPARPMPSVSFDEARVLKNDGAGSSVVLRWQDLSEVCIVTNDQGPFVDDVFWVLSGPDGHLFFPSELAGMDELVSRLLELPGADPQAVIRAMDSTEHARFIVWRSGGQTAHAADRHQLE